MHTSTRYSLSTSVLNMGTQSDLDSALFQPRC